MFRVDKRVSEYRLPINYEYRSVVYVFRCMSSEVIDIVKEEIEKLVKINFIRSVRCVEWLVNIELVIKKNGKIRECIDFRDLNNVIIKDEYYMLEVYNGSDRVRSG